MKAARELRGSDRYLLAPRSAAWEWIATFGAASAVALVYFLAARLGLALLSAPSDVAEFWPASGIAAGILIVAGRRAYPAVVIGVVVGTVAANVMSDRSLLTSLFKGLCNSGEAVLAAWLLDRWFGRPFGFGDLPRVAGFLAAAVLAAAASGTGGAATMTLLHTTAPYWEVWRVWFLSDWVGIVVVAPLVIGLRELWREPPSLGEWTEGVGALALTALVSLYAVSQESGSWISFSPRALVLPLLLWLTARCPPAFGRAGAFIASAAVILAATFGVGRFVSDAAVPLMERVRGAQASATTVTLFTLVLSALFARRKEAENQLRESEAQLAKKSAALARLHEVGLRLWHTRNMRQALDEILAGAIELLSADTGIIRILEQTRGVLKIEAHRGIKQEFLGVFHELSAAGNSACARALRLGERVVVADVESGTPVAPSQSLTRAAGFRAIQSTPIKSREGTPLGVLSTHFRSVHNPEEQDLRLLDLYVRQAADIIERHRAEDALRESEERLRLAQLRTGVGIWDLNLRTGKLVWTPQLEVLFGLEPGSVKSYADFRDRVHPEDIEGLEARRVAALQRRETFDIEYRIIRPDGQVRWMLATGGAMYDEATGEPTRILGNNVDITLRKQAELALAERNAQLALAGRAALVGTYAYDVETEMVQISEGYAAIFGFPEGTTKLVRSQWLARMHSEDLERAENLRIQAFRERRGEYNVEYRIVVPDRGVRWLEARTFISYDGNGHPRRVVGVNIDVTERKRAEEQQRILHAELDHRVKNVLATVSAVVSHTQEGSRSVASFAAALQGRISSMATTHELLSSGRWQGISLTELVRRELAPYAVNNNTEINGAEVLLKSEAGQAMAMVLHELATNAAKYGALSTKDGRVSIRWEQHLNAYPRSHLVLQWREIGGPPVIASGKPGYGTSTIRDLIPYEFGGSVDLVFASDGVLCRLELPADWISNSGEPERSSARHAASSANSNWEH